MGELGSVPKARLLALLDSACALAGDELRAFIAGLPGPVRLALYELWFWQAFRGQEEPEGDWRVWLVMAGRGFGKTRAGAEWVWARTREAGTVARNCPLSIALVGATIDEVRQVMVEGESGLVAAARTGEYARWVASRRCVHFSNGAVGFAYSAERPEKLRGPQHHFAWCDELAKWPAAKGPGEGRGEKAWDNLQMTMRLGERPRLMVTTTPRPTRLMRRVLKLPGLAIGRGRMAENWTLPAGEVAMLRALYEGTRLGRQEIEGELIEEADGAVFPRTLIEKARVSGDSHFPRGGAGGDSHFPLGGDRPDAAVRESDCPLPFRRIVVGVDPPASAAGTCGIVVCGLGADGIGYVLADASASGLSADGWAAKVAAAALAWGADRVVAEKNQGGHMVESVLRAADEALPLKLVHAAEGKALRAEPVAALFERGKAKLAGAFPELEDEMAGLSYGGGYEGPGTGPDRVDAMVWAMAELMLARAPAEPRLRRL